MLTWVSMQGWLRSPPVEPARYFALTWLTTTPCATTLASSRRSWRWSGSCRTTATFQHWHRQSRRKFQEQKKKCFEGFFSSKLFPLGQSKLVKTRRTRKQNKNIERIVSIVSLHSFWTEKVKISVKIIVKYEKYITKFFITDI